jgi:hypothetical protein
MNDIGSILAGGLAAQVLFLCLGAILCMRRFGTRKALLKLTLLGGVVAALLTTVAPGFQIFARIGLSYLPTCFADEACREDFIFCLEWLSASLAALIIHACILATALRRIPISQSIRS